MESGSAVELLTKVIKAAMTQENSAVAAWMTIINHCLIFLVSWDALICWFYANLVYRFKFKDFFFV